MKTKSTLPVWVLAATFIILLFSQCGQPIPPTGGPRDSIPPVLVKANPLDSGTNARPQKIVLEFNEYVQLQNFQSQSVFNPILKYIPQVEAKLKTVNIKIKDTLDDNTTYSIQFGNALQDINESNILKNFSYVFSTGSFVDSGKISGRVLLAESGKIDSTMIVVLHKNLQDSAVKSFKPRYMSRVNGKGYFTFKYISPGTYNIYALKDADGGLKYDQESEYFGFIDQPVWISDTTKPIKLYAFQEVPYFQKPKSSSSEKPASNKDDKRLKYSLIAESGSIDVNSDLQLSFEKKPATFDSSKLRLMDEKMEKNLPISIRLDSNMLRLSYRWEYGTKYRLLLEKGLATDTLGNAQLRNDTLKLETKKETDYGSLTIRIQELDTTLNPVLQFYKAEELKFSTPARKNRIDFKHIIPGDYEIRILFDKNNNGKWDSGNYKKKIQPEIVLPREQKLSIKANWDNEMEINFSNVLNQS
ncbi:MAG: Ig-like domain-containing domain [Chitinophagaceae bacterium]